MTFCYAPESRSRRCSGARIDQSFRGAVIGGMLLFSGPGYADALGDLGAALKGGTTNLDMRLRYEFVDVSGMDKDAHAGTLRTRLGYRTGAYQDFSGFFEVSNTTTVLGLSDYNRAGRSKPDRPVVADPTITRVNQAYLDFAGVPETLVRVGNQRVLLDNQRHVGAVGFRQQEQTLQGALLSNGGLPNTTLSYMYVDRVNRIAQLPDDKDVSHHLFNARYDGLPMGSLTAYGYLLDYDEAPASSTQTYGLRFSGSHDLSPSLALLYAAEYAYQRDYRDFELATGETSYSADYYLAELGLNIAGVVVRAGYEVLGSDGGRKGFETRLATLHAFNGWADQFLATPAEGLVDANLTVSTDIRGVQVTARFHDFSSDRGSIDYGREYGLSVGRNFTGGYSLSAKYAYFDADERFDNVQKLWLTAGLAF